MAKLCARGKAAAKRKFKVYPSAYANMYAAGVCSGRIKPKRKKKRYCQKVYDHGSEPTGLMLLTDDPMVLIQSVEDQKVRREETILNVYLCLK